ncbi:methionyl-tRNA formyltransferase [Methylobacterium dankookense]|uniref:phosphoribosylglycinamide formyltransferase 1 n=1 Tax=Methylobacterium dankookense TaxID=560405 RepID=A0A564G2Q4_9HYPH|nr:formyltransferase family protein [Methylobacterium dankookense]GJD57665.1 Methionyl-tRNA formyltransferase [Methylobacterium dankookense]VUF14783.1 Methionyl-tRNA formyltransferase [Methylobacterium dankookense]
MPTRFLVLGDGWPAAEAVRTICSHPNGHLVAYIQPRTERNKYLVQLSDFGSHRSVEYLRSSGVDWIVSANNLQIIGREALDEVKYQAINLHPALLPEYAGVHCHEWAIRNSEKYFGVSVHMILPGIDTGDVVAESKFPLADNETGLSLFTKCMREGALLLGKVLIDVLEEKSLVCRKQDLAKRQIYRHKDRSIQNLTWQENADSIARVVRSYNYEPFDRPDHCLKIVLDNNQKFDIIRARVGEFTSEKPGEIVRSSKDGVHIAAGGFREIIVTKARYATSDVSGAEIGTLCRSARRCVLC